MTRFFVPVRGVTHQWTAKEMATHDDFVYLDMSATYQTIGSQVVCRTEALYPKLESPQSGLVSAQLLCQHSLDVWQPPSRPSARKWCAPHARPRCAARVRVARSGVKTPWCQDTYFASIRYTCSSRQAAESGAGCLLARHAVPGADVRCCARAP